MPLIPWPGKKNVFEKRDGKRDWNFGNLLVDCAHLKDEKKERKIPRKCTVCKLCLQYSKTRIKIMRRKKKKKKQQFDFKSCNTPRLITKRKCSLIKQGK